MNYPEKFDSKLFTYLRKSPILHWALFLLTQKEILNYGIIQMTTFTKVCFVYDTPSADITIINRNAKQGPPIVRSHVFQPLSLLPHIHPGKFCFPFH
ncbi:hypothetical protein GAO02_21955 [Bacteroides thetaiotaomicron]|nr:hypothetical protein GAO02_21955 [Bacteroides thetaiotaomicron]